VLARSLQLQSIDGREAMWFKSEKRDSLNHGLTMVRPWFDYGQSNRYNAPRAQNHGRNSYFQI
jgi:hypothetical protein